MEGEIDRVADEPARIVHGARISLSMGIGTALTIPFLPLRSLILAAFVRGLKDHQAS